jgi:multidrug efflux pump subunit AcrA (membrane-fusion protein)
MSGSDQYTLDGSNLALVDNLLQRAELLAFPRVLPQTFHEQILSPLMTVFRVERATVWLTSKNGPIQLFAASADFEKRHFEDTDESIRRAEKQVTDWVTHATKDGVAFARCVLEEGRRSSLRARRELSSSQQLVVEFQFATEAEISSGTDETLQAVCGIVAEYHRGRLLCEVQRQTLFLGQMAILNRSLHESLDYRHVASVLAGDAPVLCGVDRISVLRCSAKRCQLIAVTGVAVINDRADVARALELLVVEARQSNRIPDWASAGFATVDDEGPADSLGLDSESVTELVNEYVQISGAKSLRVIPLGPRLDRWDGSFGAVVLERFEKSDDGEVNVVSIDVASEVMTEAASALGNSLEFDRRSLSGRMMLFRDFVRSRRLLSLVSFVVVVCLSLCLIPADFEIEVVGQMQPELRRRIFAPDGGVISRVLVHNEQTVRSGDVLLEIRNAELDIEEQRVQGEIQTTVSRLAAVEAARLGQGGRSSQNVSSSQLSAESKLLEKQLEALQRQLNLIRQQVGALKVCSPIDGQVQRRDLASDLDARPVQQGQQLLEIVQPDGPWQLQLRIPDRLIRHVLDAHSDVVELSQTDQNVQAMGSNQHVSRASLPSDLVGTGLPVRFILRTSPEKTWQETLSRVSGSTELDETGQLSSLATVPLRSSQINGLRPGAGVIASIHCGQRSIGFVWFRELIEFVQTHVLF